MRAAAACLALALGGCATLPPADLGEPWPLRRERLQQLDDWSMQGRVAVATANEGYSGGIDWEQQGSNAMISLRGPLGSGGLSIRLQDGRIEIRDRRGERLAGDEAEAYVAGQLGAPLPVRELRYWVLGVPAPGLPAQEEEGPDGRLAGLSQSGWDVRYARYLAAGWTALPGSLELRAGDVRVRLAISDWRLTP